MADREFRNHLWFSARACADSSWMGDSRFILWSAAGKSRHFECSLQWLWKPGLCAIYVYMAGLIRNLSSICSSRISVVCSKLRQWKYAQHYRFSQWYRVRYGRKRIQHLRYGLWTIRDGV